MLSAIESAKAAGSGGDRDRDRLKDLMDRMSVNPSASPNATIHMEHGRPPPLQHTSSYQSQAQYGNVSTPPQAQYVQNSTGQQYGLRSPPLSGPHPPPTNGSYGTPGQAGYASPQVGRGVYNPTTFGQMSPAAQQHQQQYFSPPPGSQSQNYQPAPPGQNPPYPTMQSGFVPPPPPGRASAGMQMQSPAPYGSGPAGFTGDPRRQQSQMQTPQYHLQQQQSQQNVSQAYPQQQQQQQQPAAPGDPWAGLNAWK